MKNIILSLSLLIGVLLPPQTIAQTWNTVGSAGFSSNSARDISIALNRNGVPYVAFADYSYYVDMGAKATVMKYNGSEWEVVGNAGFSSGRADALSMAIDNNDIPYVAYTDIADSCRATVMKYDNGHWIKIGISPAYAFSPIIKIDYNGILYVAYTNGYGGPVAVMKYDGANWISAGGDNLCTYGAYASSLIFDKDNIPILVFAVTQAMALT